jgi:Zn-finger nucleic acid-binding protein
MNALALQPSFPRRAYSGLRCPDCSVRMSYYACAHVVVQKCSNCHGLWFDDKHIAVFRETLSKFDLSELELHFAPESNAIQIISCPRCRDVLDESRYGYNTDVRIFKCGRGHGLWLPLLQTARLMDTLRLSQQIAPDVRGFLRELGLAERELRKWEHLRRLGRWISGLPFAAISASINW